MGSHITTKYLSLRVAKVISSLLFSPLLSLSPHSSAHLSLFFFFLLCFLHFSGFDACVSISEYVTSSERGPVDAI